MTGTHLETAKLHSSREALQERAIIIDNDQRPVGRQFVLLE
jgi:hypothetical protein